MAGVVMDSMLTDLLTDLSTGTTNWENQRARLYSNNHTPATSDVFSTYTLLTTGLADDYKSLHGLWGAASIASHVGSISATTVTFNWSSGTPTLYGVYIVDSGMTKLYAAQIDPNAPITLNSTVNQYQVTVQWQDQSA